MSRLRSATGAGAGDPVHVWLRDGAGVPEEFVWRGQRHRIRTAEPLPPALGRSKPGRRYQIRTLSGMRCVLLQDAGVGSWRIDRMMAPGGVR